MMYRLSTGNLHLDRELGGGLEPGRIIGIRMAPGSQGELLLKSFAITNGAMYLSTTRTNDSLEEWLSTSNGSEVTYAGIDGLMARHSGGLGDLLEGASGWDENGEAEPTTTMPVDIEPIENVVENAEQSIVIDPVNPLEDLEEAVYMQFLHDLRRRITELDQVAVLRLVEASSPMENRWLTLDIADEVWDLAVEINNGRVEFLLSVYKSRSGYIPSRTIKLELGETVAVDTSRDI